MDNKLEVIMKDNTVKTVENLYVKEVLGAINKMPLVELSNGLYNYLDRFRTRLICKENLEWAEYNEILDKGFVTVKRINSGINNGYNVLKRDGTFLSPNEDFYEVEWAPEWGNFIVERKNGKYNFLKLDGTFLKPDEDFGYVDLKFKCRNMVLVKRSNGCYNFLSADGSFFSSEDFLEVENNLSRGIISISKKNGMFNYLDPNGKLLSPNEDFLFGKVNFNDSKIEPECLVLVKRKESGKWNYLRSDGKFEYEKDKDIVIY